MQKDDCLVKVKSKKVLEIIFLKKKRFLLKIIKKNKKK